MNKPRAYIHIDRDNYHFHNMFFVGRLGISTKVFMYLWLIGVVTLFFGVFLLGVIFGPAISPAWLLLSLWWGLLGLLIFGLSKLLEVWHHPSWIVWQKPGEGN